MDLIISVVLKRPAHKEQHLCADKAYDSDDLREFVDSAGYIEHIKVNRRQKGSQCPSSEESSKRVTRRTVTVASPFSERCASVQPSWRSSRIES